ncbi:MAG TPA: hypothetical protein VGD81_02930 [Opitutaceae bacterium]
MHCSSARFLPFACLTLLALPAAAQSAANQADRDDSEDRPPPFEYLNPRLNTFSLSLRYVGRTKVTFRNLGTIATDRDAGDMTSEVGRSYDDGYVNVDTRTDSSGNDLLDDGTTNSWHYRNASQVTEDESGIAFHTYSSVSEGASVSAEAGASVGLDLEYTRQLGTIGRNPIDDWADEKPIRPALFTWGVTFGFGFNDVNVKTRDTITARLHTLTDVYSLLGAAPPDVGDGDDDSDDDINDTDGIGYTGPSSKLVTVTNPDGTTTTYTVDTTTYLANRPESRTETDTAGGATIDGFWQVKGAYLAVRTGPWVRWQPVERLSLRASAGFAAAWLGLQMRYDEQLVAVNGVELGDSVLTLIQDTDETDVQSYGIAGVFGSLDAEWWLTQRTGFFASGYYEKFSRKVELTAGDRTADIELSGGLGFRIGITTRF